MGSVEELSGWSALGLEYVWSAVELSGWSALGLESVGSAVELSGWSALGLESVGSGLMGPWALRLGMGQVRVSKLIVRADG